MLVPKAPIEALDEGIVHRLPRPAEVELHAGLVRPAVRRAGIEFGAVVDRNARRRTARLHEPIENRDHARADQGGIDLDGQTFTCEDILHRQDPDAPTVVQAIGHEVHTPPLIWAGRCGGTHPELAGALPPAVHPHAELLGAVQPIRLLVIDGPALSAKQDVQAPIAEARARRGQLPQPHPQRGQVPPLRAVVEGRAIALDDVARSPCGYPKRRYQIARHLAPPGGPQAFFWRTSWSMALSSVRSATTCFSRRFSSSSCLTRRSSATPIPA